KMPARAKGARFGKSCLLPGKAQIRKKVIRLIGCLVRRNEGRGCKTDGGEDQAGEEILATHGACPKSSDKDPQSRDENQAEKRTLLSPDIGQEAKAGHRLLIVMNQLIE